MIFPSIDDLMRNMDSKYTLVVTVAKRARQLVDGASKLTNSDSDKLVTIAIDEVHERKITYTCAKNEKKPVNGAVNNTVNDSGENIS